MGLVCISSWCVAFGHDPPLVDDHDLIGPQDGADALGDHQAGMFEGLCIQRILDFGLGLHIHGAGAIVEDQDLGMRDQRPGNSQALFLPSGEVCAALLDVRIISLREGRNEIVRLSRLGGRDDFVIAGGWVAIADIVAYRPGKQDGLLRNDRNLCQQRHPPSLGGDRSHRS